MATSLIRAFVALAGVLLLWRAVPLAIADHYAASGTREGYERAIAIQPGNADLLSAEAVFLSVTGDPSPSVDAALQRAVTLNLADSEAWMALGVRAESRGDNVAAQSALERAAAVSRLFKPAFTLVNFYFRTGQDALFWPMAERCLAMIEYRSLYLGGFDPSPIFDLAWHQDPNAARIRTLVYRHPATVIPYLRWLYASDRTDAALAFWPDALRVAEPGAAGPDVDAILGFTEHLVFAKRSLDAIRVWNDAVTAGFLPSAPLDPASGASIENPDFVFPSLSRALSWFPARQPGVFLTEAPHALRYELTGQEPEKFELLWKFVPLPAGRHWRLTWEADTSRLERPPADGAGLAFVFDEGPGSSLSACPLVVRDGRGACDVAPLPATKILRLALRYQRPLGATRLKGVLVMNSVHLQPAPEPAH